MKRGREEDGERERKYEREMERGREEDEERERKYEREKKYEAKQKRLMLK